jgi:hypothetical protein
MLLALPILLLQAAHPPPGQTPAAPVAAPSDVVVAGVQGSFLQVRMEIPGLKADERHALIVRNALAERCVFVGALPELLALVDVSAEKETGKPLTSAQWRDENFFGSGTSWKLFEASGMACGEMSMMIEGSGSHDLHAFLVRGGYRFDIHASESLTTARGFKLTREAFTTWLASLRLAVVRRGTWDQMPAPAIELMSSAFQRPTEWKSWLDERAKASPEDYAVPFAAAELLRYFESPPAEQLPAYTRAIELLAARKEPSLPEKLAHATSEDGLAIALLDSGEAEKAIPHLERGLVIAAKLTAPVRAGLTYNLACAHARLAHEEVAIARLLESESLMPGAVQRARKDKDFDPIRQSQRFQDLMNGDRGNH